MPQSDQCIKCKHYHMLGACDAYTDKIPYDIMSGKVSHTKPYPGDNGIRYEELKVTKN